MSSIGELFDLHDLMGTAEAIKEVNKRNACFQRGSLRDQRKSMISWTELEAIRPKPVERVAMTSL